MRFLVAVVALTASCGKADIQTAGEAVRLGTSWGISKPSAGTNGSVVLHLLPLIAAPVTDRFDVVSRSGNQIQLRARDGDAAALAPKVANYQLTATEVQQDVVTATFSPPLPATENIFLDGLGPFVVDSFSPDTRLVLKRREADSSKVESVEIVNFPSEEEVWRRFLGDEVDVIVLGSNTHLRRLQALPSIRLVSTTESDTIALRINMRSQKLTDPEVRRAIGLGLRREAIAEAATGSPEHAVPRPEDETEAARRLSKSALRLKILYLHSESNAMQGLLAIERQLSGLGVTVEFVAIAPSPQAGEVLRTGDHDAWVFFGGLEEQYFHMLKSDSATNFDGYSNVEFDRALLRNDILGALAILEADPPLIPLYTITPIVAYHSKFCNVRPIKTSDLTWLADVRLCAPGERD